MIINPGSDNRLIMFVRDGCEFCEEAIDLAHEVVRAEILIYVVFKSRIEGKAEIRPYRDYDNTEKMPVLVEQGLVDEVPMLYDPQLDDKIYGFEKIESYFDQFLR